jgi:L-asparaginase II
MPPLQVESTRGSLVESVHRVAVAVVDPAGRLVASNDDPDLVTFWRSAAKPFQALPLLDDGVVDHFGLDDEDLALACASHSSEPVHLAGVDRFLARVGAKETDLACGPHPPLSSTVAREVIARGIGLTARWSNCSGKHAGMLGLANHHRWPTAGYERAGHPVQTRIQAEVERWTDLDGKRLVLAVDGCTTVCFGLPLRAMALAYARFGVAERGSVRRLWRAMTGHPGLVAGTGRLCTELMSAWPGEIVAKIGAAGIYSAAIPSLRLGIAIKVLDGNFETVGVALLAVLRQVLARHASDSGLAALASLGPAHAEPPITTTRGEVIGVLRATGTLAFS